MKIWIIDAFTDRPFTGNPAAVCVLDEQKGDSWMQSVAAEMNLSETAFVQPLGQGFELRWFSPVLEVELCGHASLAAAQTLWPEKIVNDAQPIQFNTKSGVLTCTQNGYLIELDLPVTPAEATDPPVRLLDVLRINPSYIGKAKFNRYLILESEQVVRSMQPDFVKLRQVAMRGFIVTSFSSDDPRFDFVSCYLPQVSASTKTP